MLLFTGSPAQRFMIPKHIMPPDGTHVIGNQISGK